MIKTKIHTQSGDCFICELDKDMHLTKNLQVWEVANNEAKDEIKLEIYPKSWILFDLFQFLRDRWCKAITVNSGYRTAAYNASLPGAAKNSLHLKDYALDLAIPYKHHDFFIDLVYFYTIKHNLIGGVNRYPDYLHIDIAENEFGYSDFVIRDKTKDTVTLRPYK